MKNVMNSSVLDDSGSSDSRPKIFGIGMQRTGTTSLAEATRLLGWSVCHGDYGRFPGAINMDDGIYKTFNMFCDTPFFWLYEKLDYSFPGSRFVLTIRSEETWIKSVERLFEVNKGFSFSSSIMLHHTLVYGVPHFDKSRILSAFRNHNNRVKAYFADRDSDFLCVDLTQNASWDQLCLFLNCPKPNSPFPHMNKIPDEPTN